MPQLPREALNSRVLATQLPDRPRRRSLGDRPARSDQGRELLDERPLEAPVLCAPPDSLPPHDPNPNHARDVVKDVTTTAHCDYSAHGTPSRPRRRRNGDSHHSLVTVDGLDMDPVEAEQQVAAGTRTGGRAGISAPLTMVRHVEVLGRSSSWRY